ncbi:MAG: choice-of-anchor tandem repeat GloVer-containing protein [Candidatus Tumulicola sp.]
MRFVYRLAAVLFVCAWSGCAAEKATLPSVSGTTPTNATVERGSLAGFTTLYAFHAKQDGGGPQSDLIAVNGLLYGTTVGGGGRSPQCSCGTVYSIDASGKEKVIYRFKGGSDGAGPESGLTYVGGTFYGTTAFGGAGYYCSGQGSRAGCGTVFAVDAAGHERVVYTFNGGTDGNGPLGDLVLFNGMLYGITVYGGHKCLSFGCGTVFAISPAGGGGAIYRFSNGKDGAYPMAGLTALHGVLYGTTTGGGYCDEKKCGTVYTITPSGKLTIVHDFKGGDGSYPWSNLVDVNGTLYGSTYYGGNGCRSGCGTIYTIDAAGTERPVWLFGGNQDGTYPLGTLSYWHGKLYGTTQEGANTKCFNDQGCGTVFSFNPSSQRENAVHVFHNSDGAWPLTGVTLYKNALYGTTNQGGARDAGTVFRVTP